MTCAVGMADGGNSVPERRATSAWRPSVRWRGFNLLGMFCRTKMEAGDKRIFGYFPEDHFQWMEEWGFNFARLPLDYRFFVEEGDWMKPVESQLKKLDDAVRYGNLDGSFGILDTPRTDCEFEDFHGHKLDRKALELLRRH